MKQFLTFLIAATTLLLPLSAQEKPKTPATLKSVLLEQLKGSHNAKNWFVDGNTAMAGLTAEQASWKDGKGNHSVGQLTYHLVFWNRRVLEQIKGETSAKFSGNNEETFDKFDSAQWATLVQQYDQIMTEFEKIVEAADDKKLGDLAPTVANICAHNAYHIGEIVVVRKEQGVWNPEKGVK